MTKVRAAPGRKNDPQGVRRRVISVAARSFQSAGYNGTSMHDILREAGMSGGALYHHFPTKRDLARAVVRESVAAEIAATWIAAVENAPSAFAGIFRVFRDVADSLDSQDFVSGCPLGNLAIELSNADPDLRRAVEAEYRTWRDAIVAKLRTDGMEAGAIPGGSAEQFADFVVALFTGAMTLAKAAQSSAPVRSCERQLRALLAGAGGRDCEE